MEEQGNRPPAPAGGDRPAFGDRPSFGDRPPFGDRGPRGPRPPRPDGDRPGADGRPPRRFGGGGGGGGGGRFYQRRKVDPFAIDNVQPDYKDVQRLRRLISDRAKIEPRRKTGATAKNQRRLSVAIKRARHMALLPFVSTGSNR
jgi:small subunit ribosomal protein S18